MTLQPTAELGVWRDDAMDPTARGAHLLIAGISHYPHLDGGGPRIGNHAGMGQLAVSARTALRLFDWLRGQGQFSGAPIASCRLLISPSPDEAAEAAALAQNHFLPGSFDDFANALKGWGNSIFQATGAGENTAMLFFSGHGLEMFGEQILLARDAMDPDSPDGRANAVEVDHLVRALRGFGISRGFLFLDACRNDSSTVRALGIEGQKVLKALAEPRPPPTAVPCLKATGSRQFAYQVAGDPATFFGQGLLESLEGAPPSYAPYDCSGDPWRLPFGALENRVQTRVRELIAAQNASVTQPVDPYGFPYSADVVVALRPPPPAPAPAPPPLDDEFADLSDDDKDDIADISDDAVVFGHKSTRPAPARSRSKRPWGEGILAGISPKLGSGAENYDPFDLGGAAVALDIDQKAVEVFGGFVPQMGLQPDGLKDFGSMHAAFGHEGVTDPWVRSLSLIDVKTGERLDPGLLLLEGASRQETGMSITSWIDVRAPRGEGEALWLQAGEGDGRRAVVLTRDPMGDIPVRLEAVHVAEADGTWTLDSLTARVAHLPGVDQAWNILWEAQKAEQVGSLGAAHERVLDAAMMEMILYRKIEAPMAAAMAAVYLLRSGDLASLHDWPRNMANWFSWLPDGAYLWVETLKARAEQASGDERAAMIKEARTYFEKGLERGPPRLARVLTMALRQAAWLVEEAGPASTAMAGGIAMLREASLHAVANGVYVGFAGEGISPALVGGPREMLAEV
ncbi:MAG: hypothetical protein KF842_00405 [Caulobacter sp.]|nr:hypothetical protein [Caulobacter sp.]